MHSPARKRAVPNGWHVAGKNVLRNLHIGSLGGSVYASHAAERTSGEGAACSGELRGDALHVKSTEPTQPSVCRPGEAEALETDGSTLTSPPPPAPADNATPV